MMVAAAFGFWRGWQIHHGRYAWVAYGLGVSALVLAVWHFVEGARRTRI
jgi:heme exporter protein D